MNLAQKSVIMAVLAAFAIQTAQLQAEAWYQRFYAQSAQVLQKGLQSITGWIGKKAEYLSTLTKDSFNILTDRATGLYNTNPLTCKIGAALVVGAFSTYAYYNYKKNHENKQKQEVNNIDNIESSSCSESDSSGSETPEDELSENEQKVQLNPCEPENDVKEDETALFPDERMFRAKIEHEYQKDIYTKLSHEKRKIVHQYYGESSGNMDIAFKKFIAMGDASQAVQAAVQAQHVKKKVRFAKRRKVINFHIKQ